MKNKLKFELKRKFIHFFALLYVLVYYVTAKIYNHYIGLISLIVILIIFLIIDFFRLKLKVKIPFFHIFWREKESTRLGGNIFFITGVIIAFAFFSFDIALTSILMTIFGDMASALIGIQFGKHWIKSIPNRAWEGVIAEFLIDLLIAFFILNNIWISLAMALTATFVETAFNFVDDNLSIPVFSGFAGEIARFLME